MQNIAKPPSILDKHRIIQSHLFPRFFKKFRGRHHPHGNIFHLRRIAWRCLGDHKCQKSHTEQYNDKLQ